MSARLDKGAWSNGPVCWVEGNTAMISIAFTWHVPQAREAAQHYRHLGLKVRIGGSGAFTTRKHLENAAATALELLWIFREPWSDYLTRAARVYPRETKEIAGRAKAWHHARAQRARPPEVVA